MLKNSVLTAVAFLFSLAAPPAHMLAADNPGLIGIQFGSDDFDEAQELVPLPNLELAWTKQDDFGKEWAGRWIGSIAGPTTGPVTLIVDTDQAASVEIAGKVVVTAEKGTQSATIDMVKGKKQPVVLTYVKPGGREECRLSVKWSWAGSSATPIAPASLTHSAEHATANKKLYDESQDDDDDDDDDDEDDDEDIARQPGDLPYFRSDAGVAFYKQAGQLHIVVDGKLFATYVWSDPKTTRPYFKQVHALGGETQITRNHPPQPGDFSDHETYHPGIWWGFGDVGGNDYWRMKAKIIGGFFIDEPTGGDDRGSFSVRNRMLTNDGTETFCYQVCRYTFLKRPSGILVVSESTMTREESDFWLGDREEMGMAVRVATPLATKSKAGGTIRDSQGRTEHKLLRTNPSDWADYSGPIAGKHGGVLLMNDPANFRKPWWHAVDTGLLIANPPGESELSGHGKKKQNVLVEKGEPFRLRYGALVHLDDTEAQFDAAGAYEDFLSVLPGLNTRATTTTRNEVPKVPDGFKATIFAREPRIYKPTSLCFDSKGRPMLGQGPQYPKNRRTTPTDSVLLMLDTNNDGVVDESKTFATGFNSVQGLAWKGNDLYVANAPELTVVRDLDGDDEADEYIVVYTDLGNREHALHGLNWAPDGKLYMSKGNSKGHNRPDELGYVAPRAFRELWDVVHPPGAPDSYPPITYTKHNYKKTYHHWSDDWGREGGVLRCDPMGARLEIVARGLRNPWDMTLDSGFNFLGSDNDQEQGDRLVMPFFGAHFGWGHTYSSHWTGEDNLPTTPISGPVFPGSGTGIIYYSHSHFPPEYRDVFFINDWLRGTKVYRPTWDGALMQPAGGRWEVFATRGEGGSHYRPTDMEFAPDGSIYICGWGDDYHYRPNGDGSFLFRVSYVGKGAKNGVPAPAEKRAKAVAEWTTEQLLEDLGPDVIPVWRVDAQDELVRRGTDIRADVIAAIGSGKLNEGQQTWALWALGRMSPDDAAIDAYLEKLASPPKDASQSHVTPLNLRVQALRILANRVRDHAHGDLPKVVVKCLDDAEPRIRFEAVQALWQAGQTKKLPALIERMANETDRLTFYSGWRALRDLSEIAYRKELLTDERPAIRLAALLSLLEGHDITLDEVLALAEKDTDVRIQNWAMTWAMNPQPPKAMPNRQVRIELEQSFSVRSLMERAKGAKGAKLRHLYLAMISRATYDEDWDDIRDFYQTLKSDDERALVIRPLARENDSRPILWEALAGNEALRQAAIQGFASLSTRDRNSPERIANFLLSKASKEPANGRLSGVVETLSRLNLPDGWQPTNVWDEALSQALEGNQDVRLRAKVLSLLLAIDPKHVASGAKTKVALEKLSRNPAPRLYASLVALNPRLGVQVEMEPPEQATIAAVLAKLPTADAEQGRELFFDSRSSAACLSCHRLSGSGNNLGPDLSGIGLRAEPEKIIRNRSAGRDECGSDCPGSMCYDATYEEVVDASFLQTAGG